MNGPAFDAAGGQRPDARRPRAAILGAGVLVALIAGLVAYKWPQAFGVVEKARATGAFAPRAEPIPAGGLGSFARPLAETASYLLIVWPALLFGTLIAAAVRAFVAPRHVAWIFGASRWRSQLAAAAAGAPLMLCSCCVAPIFASVYERTHRLGPSLALMVGSPALNLGPMVLTFVFFGPAIGGARLAMAVSLVLLLAVFDRPGGEAGTQAVQDDPAPRALLAAASDFGRAVGHVAVRTLPAIVLGVFAARLLAERLPATVAQLPGAGALAVVVAASVALPMALPTFFEIPLAAALLGAGAPAGAALAVLFAGPAVNLPSLFTVARTSSWRAAAGLAAAVWAVAVVGGVAMG